MNTRSHLTSACYLIAALLLPTAVRGDDAAPTSAPSKMSLDDLGADLLDEQPAEKPADRGLKTPPADAGAGPPGQGSSSLAIVADRMKRAALAIAARDTTGTASATQQQAVDELDAMIARLQKQCESCGGQCNKPGQQANKPPKPGGKAGAKPGETNALAKTADAGAIDRSALGKLVKDLWGRLPERQQDELLQPLSEEFLPEYAADIEEYFRVLAETPSDKSPEAQP